MNDANILGGGGLGYVVDGGEIYIKAEHLASLFSQTGAAMGIQAITTDCQATGAVAHALMLVAEKTDALRSELLRREAEASLLAMLDLDSDEGVE